MLHVQSLKKDEDPVTATMVRPGAACEEITLLMCARGPADYSALALHVIHQSTPL
jgi:hypothetical protein